MLFNSSGGFFSDGSAGIRTLHQSSVSLSHWLSRETGDMNAFSLATFSFPAVHLRHFELSCLLSLPLNVETPSVVPIVSQLSTSKPMPGEVHKSNASVLLVRFADHREAYCAH